MKSCTLSNFFSALMVNVGNSGMSLSNCGTCFLNFSTVFFKLYHGASPHHTTGMLHATSPSSPPKKSRKNT
ncbi:hypothetical protein THERMOT_934 [Bathymodiolus thermophilus thioautotrophic gill symbiont]|nr:hypothetical protein THERMOT_934 [Bathymodiolus thermophilus thioautotrophic gill symbiont]